MYDFLSTMRDIESLTLSSIRLLLGELDFHKNPDEDEWEYNESDLLNAPSVEATKYLLVGKLLALRGNYPGMGMGRNHILSSGKEMWPAYDFVRLIVENAVGVYVRHYQTPFEYLRVKIIPTLFHDVNIDAQHKLAARTILKRLISWYGKTMPSDSILNLKYEGVWGDVAHFRTLFHKFDCYESWEIENTVATVTIRHVGGEIVVRFTRRDFSARSKMVIEVLFDEKKES